MLEWVGLTMLSLLAMARPAAASDRIYTFLEGRLYTASSYELVLSNDEGTYWIYLSKPVNYKTKLGPGRYSFWVARDQIVRYRPRSLTQLEWPRRRAVERIAGR